MGGHSRGKIEMHQYIYCYLLLNGDLHGITREAEKLWMSATFYHQIQDVGTADDKYKPTFGGDS